MVVLSASASVSYIILIKYKRATIKNKTQIIAMVKFSFALPIVLFLSSSANRKCNVASALELVTSIEPRCGTSELDAREHCRNTCVSDFDCSGAGEYCWGVHPVSPWKIFVHCSCVGVALLFSRFPCSFVCVSFIRIATHQNDCFDLFLIPSCRT